MTCENCGWEDQGQKVHPCRFNEKELEEGLKMIEIKHGWLKWKDWGDHAEYRSIFVREDQRRKGIGSKLLDKLKKIKNPIITFVNTDKDDWLGKFLLSCGFEFIEAAPEKFASITKDYKTIMLWKNK